MRIFGLIICIILLVVGVTWLRNEAPDIFSPQLRNIFQFPSSSYTTSWADTSTTPSEPRYITSWSQGGPTQSGGSTPVQQGGSSPYRGAIVVESVVIGTYRAVVLRNQGTSPLMLSGWRIQTSSALVTIPGGIRQGTSLSAHQPILLAPGESVAIFDTTHDLRATAIASQAVWSAWPGVAFLPDRGLITLRDEAGREVLQYTY